MEVTYICFNEIKRKYYYTLLPPLNMNKMKFFNLVYKIKEAKLRKAVRWIIFKWHIFKIKTGFKNLYRAANM